MSSLSLLEDEPVRRPSPWPLRALAVAAILALSGLVFYWQFRYYPEQRKVEQFMDALQAGDYPAAYQLWNPAPTYSYNDFLEDWGETTPFGRVRSYEIVGVESSGEVNVSVPGKPTLHISGASSGVVVSVRINGQLEPVRIWVEKKDKSLSFPPF